MGHPYNQAQQIVLQNLSAQRFVGTDIQKNILYGRDLPVLRFNYTGLQKGVSNDSAALRYELVTSGTYIPTILDEWNINATGYYYSRGVPLDRSSWGVAHSGIEQGIPFDYPVLGYITSGLCDPAFRQVTHSLFKYTGVDVVSIPYDRPSTRTVLPSAGGMLGIIQELPERAGFFFETGVMFGGDHIPVQFDIDDVTEDTDYHAQFFFQTGRLDGPGS